MQYLSNLSDDPIQSYTIIGEAGQNISLVLRYLPTQQGWMFNLSYDKFAMNGAGLTVSLNILRQYRKVLNFGMAVFSEDGLESYYLSDFITGRIKIYILNQEEVNTIEALYFT